MHKCVTTLCYVTFGFFLTLHPTASQKANTSFSLKNGISKPYIQATHPFGVLLYTLPHNFKARPEQVSSINIQLNSGNVWGQQVTTFIPSSISDRTRMDAFAFYNRASQFDPNTNPSESYTIAYDGVIKDLRLTATFPLAQQNDLTITARSFLLSKGTFPSSFITSDRFIESFHSNLAGGNDPFGRKAIGFDQAQIHYIDRDGNSMLISPGAFVFSGIEAAFYFYPQILAKRNIHLNIGTHVGANLSSYNKSLDVGFSLAGIKEFKAKEKYLFLFGTGINIMRKSLISFGNNQVDLGTSTFLGSIEGHFEVSKRTNRNGYHSLGLNYRIQTPYNNKKEEAFYVPTSEGRIKRWHDASRQLYLHSSYWSLIYSFTKRTVFSIYLQQDMLVNNAPDLQTGVRIKIPFRF